MSNYKFQQLAPTPARGKFDPKLYNDENWYAEEKYDGDRRIAQFIDGRVRFTGRRISDVDGLYVEKTENLPHLNIYDTDTVLEGTVLDGEIICPWEGARSKDVTSIMGSKPELAIKKQKERGYLAYRVFDCLFLEGEDVRKAPLHVRRSYAATAVELWANKHVELARRVQKDKEGFVLEIWERGGEGVILKHRDSKYHEEKLWVKVKKENTEDVVIIGYEDAKEESTKVSGKTSATKYHLKGWVGAVRFGQYVDGELVDCGKCSGMTDELREELSKNKKKYLGRVVEILANEREPTGRFRHPRWVRFRDDKNPKECVWRRGLW